MCGSSPIPPGVEVSGTVGTGQRNYQAAVGCGTALVEHQVREFTVGLEIRRGFESGWTFATAAGISQQTDEVRGAPATNLLLGQLSLRGGYRGAYAGFELGPSVLFRSDWEGQILPVPSFNLWVGVPRFAYLYVELFTAPLSAVALPLSVGVGHQSESLRVQVGAKPGNTADGLFFGACPALHVDGQVRIGRVWLGMNADACDEEIWRAGLSLGYSFDLDEEPEERRGASPRSD